MWTDVAVSCQKSDFQSQLSMSKMMQIFPKQFSLKNINLGAHFVIDAQFLTTRSKYKKLSLRLWILYWKMSVEMLEILKCVDFGIWRNVSNLMCVFHIFELLLNFLYFGFTNLTISIISIFWILSHINTIPIAVEYNNWYGKQYPFWQDFSYTHEKIQIFLISQEN